MGALYMLRASGQEDTESKNKTVALLELLAAFTILSIVALVFYMVLSYRAA
jgi:hypothetical protein